MSISAAVIRELVAAGLSGDALVAACERIDAAESRTPARENRTARQERNARYYEARKGRLKASENRLKTSYSDAPPQGSMVSPTPPSLTPNSPPQKETLKGFQKGTPNPSESPSAPKPRKPSARPMSERWVDGPEAYSTFEAMVEAGEAGWDDFDRLTAEFRDYHESRGSMFVSWPAALRTWVRNDRKFKPKGGQKLPFDGFNGFARH